MRRALLVSCALWLGCAGIVGSDRNAGFRDIAVASECADGDIDLQIEVDAGITSPCSYWLGRLRAIEDAYRLRWGTSPLSGWRVRLVTHIDSPGAPDQGGRILVGTTWFTEGVIDLVRVTSLAHEMHHAELGPSSYDHHGWCPIFTDWERDEPLVAVDDSYLCP